MAVAVALVMGTLAVVLVALLVGAAANSAMWPSMSQTQVPQVRYILNTRNRNRFQPTTRSMASVRQRPPASISQAQTRRRLPQHQKGDAHDTNLAQGSVIRQALARMVMAAA